MDLPSTAPATAADSALRSAGALEELERGLAGSASASSTRNPASSPRSRAAPPPTAPARIRWTDWTRSPRWMAWTIRRQRPARSRRMCCRAAPATQRSRLLPPRTRRRSRQMITQPGWISPPAHRWRAQRGARPLSRGAQERARPAESGRRRSAREPGRRSRHPELHRLLGDARIRQGDYLSALESYNRAVALTNAHEDCARNLQEPIGGEDATWRPSCSDYWRSRA